MPTRLRLRVIACTASLGIWAIGCTSGPAEGYFGTTTPRHDAATLYFGNGSEPQSLDPGRVYDSPGNEIVRNLFEGLVANHSVTLEPIPGMAERWETSADGLTWTFHLRPAQWSDGEPVTAHDFVYAWTRVLDPATGAQYANMLWVLENGEAFNTGKLKDRSKVGVKALDDRTLVVKLQYPAPYFLHLAAYSPFFPVRRDVVEKHGDRWIRPEHIVSNGAFTLESWRLRYEIVLEKNPRYWAADQVRLARAVAMTIEDGHTVLRLYKTGLLDWTGVNGRVPAENVPFVKGYKDYRSHPYLALYYLWLNVEKPALKDKRVRQALNLAIDKEKIVKFVTKGGQIPATHMVPDVQMGEASTYRSPKGEPFNPERARALLAEAGYPGGKGFPVLEYTYNTDESHRQIAEAIQAMWREHLGIQAQLANVEFKVHLDNQNQGNFEVARAGWVGDYPEPSTFLELLRPGSPQNNSRWNNQAFGEHLDKGLRARTDAERNAHYAAAEKLIIEEAPIIPLYIYTYNELVKPYVRGIHPNVRHLHPLRDVWIETAPPEEQPARAGKGSR